VADTVVAAVVVADTAGAAEAAADAATDPRRTRLPRRELHCSARPPRSAAADQYFIR